MSKARSIASSLSRRTAKARGNEQTRRGGSLPLPENSDTPMVDVTVRQLSLSARVPGDLSPEQHGCAEISDGSLYPSRGPAKSTMSSESALGRSAPGPTEPANLILLPRRVRVSCRREGSVISRRGRHILKDTPRLLGSVTLHCTLHSG